MATEIELETSINTANSAKSLRELSKGLRELVSLQGSVGQGTAEFRKLQTAINDTEGRIGDLNDGFNTLRGSGVERLNSSLGLFREGLASADPGKLKIAMDGLSTAMKAVPIFLLIQGFQYLSENLDKITALFSESAKQAKINSDALRDLTMQTDFQNASLETSIVLKTEELRILKEQNAPLSQVINKIKELQNLKSDQTSNELKKIDFEINNLLLSIKAAQDDFDTKTSLETLLGLGTSEADIKKLEDDLAALQLKRSTFYTQNISQENSFNSTISQERQKAADEALKKAQEQYEKERKESGERLQKQKELEEGGLEEMEAMIAASNAKTTEIIFDENAAKLNASAMYYDALKKFQDESAANAIAKSKEQASQFVSGMEQANQALQYTKTINDIISNLENNRIREMQYAKDAEIQNDANRAQEAIDNQIRLQNEALNNEALTLSQREQIKFNTETSIRQIEVDTYNNKLKAEQEFQKKDLEIRKKQFKRDRALALLQVAIDGAIAAGKAIAMFGPPPSPAGIAGLAAAAATTGLAVASILSKNFDDGGASAMSAVKPITSIDTRPAPSTGGAGFGSTNPSNQNAQGQLLGSGLTTNSNGIVKVVVLQSDIREAVSKVDVLENRATFGT